MPGSNFCQCERRGRSRVRGRSFHARSTIAFRLFRARRRRCRADGDTCSCARLCALRSQAARGKRVAGETGHRAALPQVNRHRRLAANAAAFRPGASRSASGFFAGQHCVTDGIAPHDEPLPASRPAWHHNSAMRAFFVTCDSTDNPPTPRRRLPLPAQRPVRHRTGIPARRAVRTTGRDQQHARLLNARCRPPARFVDQPALRETGKDRTGLKSRDAGRWQANARAPSRRRELP